MGHGEVREELLHLDGTHGLRMPFVMEQDEPSDPLHLGVFRAETIVLGADSHTHLLQKPGRLIPWGVPLYWTIGYSSWTMRENHLYTTHMYTITKMHRLA